MELNSINVIMIDRLNLPYRGLSSIINLFMNYKGLKISIL